MILIYLSLEMDILEKRKGGVTLLHLASQGGWPDIVSYLISKGAELEAEHQLGSPLEWAVSSRHNKVAKVLL